MRYAILCALALSACARPHETRKSSSYTEAARDAALAAAQVWHEPAIPVGKADLSKNPDGPGAFRDSEEVTCRFVHDKVSGTTPKFNCELDDGDVVKVKYGSANPEVPAEVAATRLFEALGFGTDRMYVVRSVRCLGCPMFPFGALKCARLTGWERLCFAGANPARPNVFLHAIIERRAPGKKIEASPDQGWSWDELDRIDPARGGATRGEVDAFRLLAVLLAHWDNKGANQRLVCLSGKGGPDGACAEPFALVSDLGATFGPGKLDLHNWSRVAVWSDPAACRVSMKSLPFGGATFPDHRISEEGRELALRLLGALTAEQLQGLFVGSGATQFDHVLADAGDPDAWVEAFQKKVAEMRAGGPCAPAAELEARGE